MTPLLSAPPLPPCVSPGKWHIAETITIVGRRRRSRGLTFPIEISHSSDGAATRRSVHRLHCMALARALSLRQDTRPTSIAERFECDRFTTIQSKHFPKRVSPALPPRRPFSSRGTRDALQEETRVWEETRVVVATYSPGLSPAERTKRAPMR